MSRDKRRHHVVCLRANDDELRRLEDLARQCGLPRSRFIRDAALGVRLRTRLRVNERDAIHQLARVGSNLNQLARHANATRRVELSRRLAEVLDEVVRAIRRLA